MYMRIMLTFFIKCYAKLADSNTMGPAEGLRRADRICTSKEEEEHVCIVAELKATLNCHHSHYEPYDLRHSYHKCNISYVLCPIVTYGRARRKYNVEQVSLFGSI